MTRTDGRSGGYGLRLDMDDLLFDILLYVILLTGVATACAALTDGVAFVTAAP